MIGKVLKSERIQVEEGNKINGKKRGGIESKRIEQYTPLFQLNN